MLPASQLERQLALESRTLPSEAGAGESRGVPKARTPCPQPGAICQSVFTTDRFQGIPCLEPTPCSFIVPAMVAAGSHRGGCCQGHVQGWQKHQGTVGDSVTRCRRRAPAELPGAGPCPCSAVYDWGSTHRAACTREGTGVTPQVPVLEKALC